MHEICKPFTGLLPATLPAAVAMVCCVTGIVLVAGGFLPQGRMLVAIFPGQAVTVLNGTAADTGHAVIALVHNPCGNAVS